MSKPEVDLSVDLLNLDEAIYRYVHEVGLDLATVVRNTSRLILKEIVAITPPKSYAQGRKAVARDIGRSVMPLDPNKTFDVGVKKMLQKKDYAGIRAYMAKTGWLGKRKLTAFSVTIHTKARDSRGRVRKTKSLATMDLKEYKKYVSMMQKRVGYTKSWWSPAARVLGLPVPQWVARHAAPNGVAVVDKLNDSSSPSIQMINSSVGAASISRSRLQGVIRRRASNMIRDIHRILEGGKSRYF